MLVVDDDEHTLTAMEAILTSLDVDVDLTRSGERALRHLLEREFAVLILDVHMPTMGGFELARLIRSRPRLRHTPIIFVTAHSQREVDARRGYDLGAADYLFKPIVPEILRAKVQVLVDLHQRTAQVARQAERLRQIERESSLRVLRAERQRWEEEGLRREMEEQRRLNGKLAEIDRRKDEFLAVLAHELRNPIAPLVTNLELIRSAPNEERIRRSCDAMERQVRHLRRLVDDLLEVSRITRGKLSLQPARVDLEDIVSGALELSRPHLEQRDQRVATHRPAEPVWLDADPVRLTQVLSNLLHNASRYSEPGQEIEVTWGRDDGDAFLRVIDRGRGVSKPFLERMFEMFAQEHEGARGLGLGLTVAKELVELHGGTITAASEGPGRGCEFTVRLPVAESTVPASPEVEHPTDPDPESLRIVVVEDDDDIRDSLADLLESWGHEVERVDDGPSGVAAVCEVRPDLVLLDIGLPGMDGHQVARRLRERLGAACPRLVAMTGYGQRSDRESSREAGFDLHVVKPASIEDIHRALRECPPRSQHADCR